MVDNGSQKPTVREVGPEPCAVWMISKWGEGSFTYGPFSNVTCCGDVREALETILEIVISLHGSLMWQIITLRMVQLLFFAIILGLPVSNGSLSG